MAADQSTSEKSEWAVTAASDTDGLRVMTIPNLLTAIRLVGSLGLVALAVGGQSHVFAVLFILLVMTDWADGKLARWLHQRTDLGARLDSMADAALFAALALGCLLLKSEMFIAEKFWVTAAILSYGLTTVAGLWKFGGVPAYHTRAAKTSWYAIMVAVIFTFLDWSPWPFRVAMLAVTLTNLEATLITRTLPSWQADVPSLIHARRIRDRLASSDELTRHDKT